MEMRSNRYRAALSLLVFLGWILITAFLPRLWEPVHVTQSLNITVATHFSVGIAAAIAFLLAAIAVFGWNDIGFNRPRSLASLGLLWFPAVYIGLFAVLGLAQGPPPIGNALIILINTAMVGISEEVACRGILFQGLRSRFSLRGAILGSTLLFGAVHIFNGFSTGDFASASLQAVTAFMTGIAFMGIRLRTGSLLPGIALHAAWDFTSVASTAGTELRHGANIPAGLDGWQMALPLLFILPNFLYGLYLLRHAEQYEGTATSG
ncbi:MAG: CPBP family intramembrane metalloprotease [Sphingobacteriales bacterium]|nr:MAG: CPBP family intramembrane metalloprotease [Sphingobacteriales bacterium]